MQIENLTLCPIKEPPLCAPAVIRLKSTMLTAAATAAGEELSQTQWLSQLLEDAFEVSSFVELATFQHSHTCRQATNTTDTLEQLYE